MPQFKITSKTTVAQLLAAFAGQTYPVNLRVINANRDRSRLPVPGGVIVPPLNILTNEPETTVVVAAQSQSDLQNIGINALSICRSIGQVDDGFVVMDTTAQASGWSFNYIDELDDNAFQSLSALNAAVANGKFAGVTALNPVPVVVGGQLGTCDGANFLAINRVKKPILVAIGDSINAGQNGIDSSVTLSGNGLIGTIGTISVGVVPGQRIYISGVANDEWNGEKIIDTWDSANSVVTFTNSVLLTSSPTAISGMVFNVVADGNDNQRGFLTNFNNWFGALFDIRNRSVSGVTSTFTLSRYSKDVLSLNPAVIYDNVGINDVNSGTVTEDQTISNIESMMFQAYNLGIEYWRAEITPISETGTNYSLAKKKQILRLNQRLKQLAEKYPNVTIIPANAALIDKSTGNVVASYFDDPTGVHSNSTGMNQIFKQLISIFANKYVRRDVLVNNPLWAYSYDNTAKQAVRNPLLVGTQAASGTGVTGTIPTNFSVVWDTRTGTGSAACSVVARSDGYGNDLQIVLSGATNDNDRIGIRPTIDKAAFSNGDIVRFSMSLSRSGASNMRAISMSLFNTSTYWSAQIIGGDAGTNFFGVNDDVSNLPIISDTFVWGDWQTNINSLNIWVVFRANAAGTFSVGRISFEKVG